MTRWNAALALSMGALLAACQAGPEKTSTESKNEALERRVAELERKAETPAPMMSPLPAETQLLPGGEAASQPAAARPRTADRPAPRTPSRAVSRPARERAEVVRSVPSDERPDRGAEAGDPGPRRGGATLEAARERVTIPEGTTLTLVMETTVSSATSKEGDPIVARVERAVSNEGRILLPGGTVLKGKVTEVESSGRVQGRARIALSFDRIVVRGQSHELDTTEIEVAAPSGAKRDAVVIGGGTAAGAVIGGIAGGGKGAKKGALIGAGAGTGAVLLTKGKEVQIPAGSRWTVTTKDRTRLD